MMPLEAIAAVGTNSVAAVATARETAGAPQVAAPATNFAELLSKGLEQVEQKVAQADEMVRAFALDDTLPVHQVTIALEEARIAIELAMQVRTRLVEAYREIMNTQL